MEEEDDLVSLIDEDICIKINDDNNKNKKKKMFFCQFCGKGFTRSSSVRRHVKSVCGLRNGDNTTISSLKNNNSVQSSISDNSDYQKLLDENEELKDLLDETNTKLQNSITLLVSENEKLSKKLETLENKMNYQFNEVEIKIDNILDKLDDDVIFRIEEIEENLSKKKKKKSDVST